MANAISITIFQNAGHRATRGRSQTRFPLPDPILTLANLHLVVTIASVAFVLVAMMGLRQHRTPQSAFAWLLFTALIPYAGVPAFLALGNRKSLPKRRIIGFGKEPAPDSLPPVGIEIGRLAAHSRLPQASSGNSLSFVTNGNEAWERLTELISAARCSLDLSFYKWSNDEIGLELAGRLAARAREGIRVRLLLDAYGSRYRPRRALREIVEAGGEVLIFAPLVDNPIRGHINLRNHRKLAIADSQVVFAGGVNIGLEYMGPLPDAARWSDLAYVCRGHAVSAHCHVFEADWARAGGAPVMRPAEPASDPDGSALVQFIPSGPDIQEDVLHDSLVLASHMAARRIVVITPYFLPSPTLSAALSIAARRGVEVSIVVPERSNQKLADLARTSFLREMRQSGANVLAHPGMVHAKAVIFDDCAFVGSANLDIRSLYVNFETMLAVYSAPEIRRLEEWSQELMERCGRWKPSSRLASRLVEAVFRLAAPLM